MLVVLLLQGMPNDFTDVSDLTVVVKAGLEIYFSAARAAIPPQNVPSLAGKAAGHALDVVAIRVAFQPVGEYDEFLAVVVDPVQIDKVAILQPQSLSSVADIADAAGQSRVNGLQMRVEQVPGFLIGGAGESRHGIM